MRLEKIIGHRGASAYAPENTLASFNKALSLGCRFIEFDVMLSADGEPFIFHDDYLKRTSNGKGAFHLANTHYLRQLDAGSWFSTHFQGEKIPHFKETIDWLAKHDMMANVEIKAGGPISIEQTARTVLDCIKLYWPAEKSLPLISSFDWEVLVACKRLRPNMPLALLIHDWEDSYLQKAKELECTSIHFNHRILSQERVQEAKAEGYVIRAYTINRKRLAKTLFDWGVDALFSDYPDLLAFI